MGKDLTEKQIIEARRKQFEEIYKETFGVYPVYEEENENDSTVFVLNIYGIKSDWM